MANGLGSFIASIGKVLADDKKVDPDEARRMQRFERQKAEQAMKNSLRLSLREIESRENDLAQRKNKIRQMAGKVPEQQLLTEAGTVRTQEQLALKMRKIRAGQEQAYLVTTALSTLQDFSRGLAGFEKLAQLSLDSRVEDIDLVVQNTMDELVRLENAFDSSNAIPDGDTFDRHAAENRAYLDSILAPVTDVADESADRDMSEITARLDEQRKNLSGRS